MPEFFLLRCNPVSGKKEKVTLQIRLSNQYNTIRQYSIGGPKETRDSDTRIRR